MIIKEYAHIYMRHNSQNLHSSDYWKFLKIKFAGFNENFLSAEDIFLMRGYMLKPLSGAQEAEGSMAAFNLLTSLGVGSEMNIRLKGESFLMELYQDNLRRGNTPLNYEYFYRHPAIEQSTAPRNTSSSLSLIHI
eukprot:TRINITY_DN9943_c0_g1_i1.p1 TRINITY_DN9943_c0_g1~~TRINITY_DN9943_c0_g1_i1.p1  ORF type:complete len:135 (-),score=24.31 TRINITY_DN9943_c0_g1_i1:43-447(-)